MEFIREYQQIIVSFVAAVSAALAFFYHLLSARQSEYERRTDETLDDHELRLRQSVDRTEWADLVAEMRALKSEMHEVATASCAHNTQTRLELHTAVVESERRLADKIDAVFMRLGEQR